MQFPNVLKIIYAPHRAFKEISENPTYLGPILIIILFVALNAGFAYTAVSKTYVEQTWPNGLNQDEWTENSTLWTSNVIVTESNDSVEGAYYGNRSISFSATDTSQLSMQLTNIESLNCSSQDGPNLLSLRVKQISPQGQPQKVSAFLHSSSSDYFSYDLTQDYALSTGNSWRNLTITLVTGWKANGQNADWSKITGLKLEFLWVNSSSVTILLDGLFFHGPFKSLLETAGSSYLLNFALAGAMQFVITWVILCGLLYLLSKTLGAAIVWKLLLILVGCILITLAVQALINIAAYSTLTKVEYPFALVGGVAGEGDALLEAIMTQTGTVTLVGRITQVAIYVWTIALCGIAVHVVGGLSWTKSFLAAVVAYLVTIFVGGFLFG